MGPTATGEGSITGAIPVGRASSLGLDISWPNYFKVSLTLLLLAANIYLFEIEDSLRLSDLLTVLVPFYLIYMILPKAWRLSAMLIGGLGCLLYLFGPLVASLVVGGVAIFLGITMLPTSWRNKVILVSLYTGLLIWYRGVYATDGMFKTAAIIVGVLLMFRSILYMYELKYEKEEIGTMKRILYFLLPPNFIFYIFPIVDWKTFRRSFYAAPAVEIYEKGLKWIFTGFVHLLAYRLMYYYLMPHPDHLETFNGMVRYMLVSYALIVRLSGLFHMSAGLLCLFGFNLPPTFHNYFLATNFSELWRRINIYWKDFVMKVFYFPVYFKFKKRDLSAVFLTVLVVFFFNWLLHGYQWFWIRGSFLLKDTDIIFWSLLGLFVALNSVWLRKSSNDERVSVSIWKEGSIKVAKIMGMFLVMSLLWGFWISPSVSTWVQMLLGVASPTSRDILLLLGGIGMVFILGVLVYKYLSSKEKLSLRLDSMHSPAMGIVQAASLAIFLTALPSSRTFLGNVSGVDLKPVYTSQLNAIDEAQMFKGYYDELILGNDINNQMWDKEAKKPEEWGKLKSSDLLVITDDIIGKKLKSNFKGYFKEKVITTNSFGIRDKQYSKDKPENVMRIIMLGGSLEMGSGVADNEVFEAIVEDSLNKLRLEGGKDSIEIMNFSISGIHMPQHVGIVENRIEDFSPDVIIYTAHPSEKFRALRKFAFVLRSAKTLNEYPLLEELKDELAISAQDTEPQVMRKLSPYRDSLYAWGMKRISDFCVERDISMIYLDVPDLGRFVQKEDRSELSKLCRRFDFYYVDLWPAFDGYEKSELMTAEFDQHPNDKGHLVIAEYLLDAIQSDPDLRRVIFEDGK